MWLVFVVLGLACGFVDATLGMGFGVSSVSLLVTVGIAPAIASASVHTAEAVVDTVSGVSHWKLGNVEPGLLWRLTIPGAFGAMCGAMFLVFLVSTSMGKPFINAVLLVMGVIVLFRFARQRIATRKLPTRWIPLLGFVAAFIDASGGGGWGPLCTPMFLLGGSEPRKAVGTVEITEPIISVVAMVTFGVLIGFDTFLWSMVLPIIVGGFLLTPFAAYLSKKLPVKAMGILIGVWLIGLNGHGVLTFLLRWMDWSMVLFWAFVTTMMLGLLAPVLMDVRQWWRTRKL